MTARSIEQLEHILGRLLATGVAASSLCLAAGLLIALAHGPDIAARTLLTLGVVVLLATPVLRVAISSVGLALRREWLFVVLTLVVLAELFASIAAALAM